MTKNEEIREIIKRSKIYHWELAEKLKISESTLVRRLRNELSEFEKERIMNAIKELRKESEYDINN